MTEIYEVKYIKFVQASMHHYDCFKVLKLALVASSPILASLMSSPYIIMLSLIVLLVLLGTSFHDAMMAFLSQRRHACRA
jgi:hypothetical protein